MLIRPMESVNGGDGSDTDVSVGGEHGIHVGQLLKGDRYRRGVLVPSLADQSHGDAGKAICLGPDDPVAVDESDIRRGRFGDGGVGVDEQRVVKAVALRDAPALKGTEQSDVFDVRHIAAIDRGLQAQRGKWEVRSWSGCDQDLWLRVHPKMPEFEGGIEYGHPYRHWPADVCQRVANEVPDAVSVEVGIKYLAAVTHQALQVK